MVDIPNLTGKEKLVWDAASQVEKDSEISIWYKSKRSDRIQHRTGVVYHVIAREDKCEMKFKRDDGNKMKIKDDGSVYSIGSNYPHTGWVTSIKIDDNDKFRIDEVERGERPLIDLDEL